MQKSTMVVVKGTELKSGSTAMVSAMEAFRLSNWLIVGGAISTPRSRTRVVMR